MIVFVPGIKGSELFEGDNKRWFPSTEKDLDLLDITNDLDASSIIRHVTPFGISKMSHIIYRGILDKYSQEEIAPFPYDWRQSIFNHVNNLADKIVKESKVSGEKVTLIAHSMGGLLAKLAIQKLEERKELHVINKLITIGTPWHGAPDSFKALLYGEPGVYEKFKQILQFITVKGTRKLARMSPSVYQLLPSEDYFNHTDGKFVLTENEKDISYDTFKSIIQNIHDEDKPNTSFVDVWKTYIDPLHKAMKLQLPDGIHHDCLIGYSYPTLYKVPEVSKVGVVKKKYKKTSSFMNGDGVVPLHSAIPSHKATLYLAEGEHAKLCSTQNVLDFIDWSINGNGEIPSSITKVTDGNFPINSQLKAGFLAKIMCPVDSTILDEQGKYVAGVFDTNISDISELAEDDNIKVFSVGEASYIYFAEQNQQDLTFNIHAYDEGVASVSIEMFDTSEDLTEEINFETIPVGNNNSAVLKIPGKKTKSEEAYLNYKGNKIKGVRRRKKEKTTIESPTPKIKVSFEASDDTKKVPYKNTFSGPAKVKIESEQMDNIKELFFSIDGKDIQKYTGNNILNLENGQHIIEAFGKDIYDRALYPAENKIHIDNLPPRTELELQVDPDGIFVLFKGISNNSNIVTNYRIINTNDDKDVDWKTADSDYQITVPSIQLRENPKHTVKIEFYSINNDLGFTEEVKTFEFGLGIISELMWSDDHINAVTPSMVFDELFQHERYNINDFEVSQVIQNKNIFIKNSDIIGDNVKSIIFKNKNIKVSVHFAEKYSLFFSGSPTELLKLDQEYDFSFELKTERTNENIVTTDPKARLQPIKRGKFSSREIKLDLKNGVFKGKFKVDSNFEKFKHKLIITDNKNINPPLREIMLLLNEDDNKG